MDNTLLADVLQHLIVTGAKAASNAVDGDPNTKAKDVLNFSLKGVTKSPTAEAAEGIFVDAIITPDMFGEDEAKAEELLNSIIDKSQRLFELALKHKK